MLTAKRSFPIAFIENGVTEAKLTRGMVMFGLVLSVVYSVTLTGAATSVRALALPIKRLSLIGDNGKVLHSIVPADAITKARLYEQTPLAALLTPPTVTTTGTQSGEAHLPLFFKQAFADNGDLTSLPTFAYDDLTLRVEWGSVAELFVGGVGSVAVTVGNSTFTQLDAADFPMPDPIALARSLGVSVDRYKQAAATGVANREFPISVPVTADIRAIILTTEDANGEPTNAILNTVTLLENNSVRVYSNVPAKTLRADNAKIYGGTMPTGVCVIEFAEDGDISDIYAATKKDTVDLLLDVAAVAGNIRAHFVTIEHPKAA